jgi:23S rRNA (adenine2503-C2)-methyltransferase
MEKDLKNMTLPQLEQAASEFKQKPFLARYIFTFIHQKGCNALDQITTLSRTFRAELQKAEYFISSLKTLQTFEDPDGTVKFVFELLDGCRMRNAIPFVFPRRSDAGWDACFAPRAN